ncbi:hypothetical protein [Thioclava indica]|uniref:Sulfotransferase domain-containing protein n=1 Tax=Thioclava indica TaxID=1353528 RepID=A0A074JU39_9RHOB|nr:hypothetical protein [Thioclava indica]KEO61181.1 hypothetical protein DT23_10635 [Thioclava indica]
MTVRRRVVIHVGQTKAGSTSLQNYLEAERDMLLQRGWVFPRSILGRHNPFDKKRTPGHLPLLTRLSTQDTAEFEAELAAAPEASVILSVENLFSDQPDKALERLGTFFNDWDVEILAVLRPQLDWLWSRYVENILSGFRCSTERFETYARKALDNGTLDYGRRIAHVQRLLGARKASAIQLSDEKGPLVARFLDFLGIPDIDETEAEKAHDNRRGRAAFLIEAKRRLNTLTKELSVIQRLELEHKLRQRAAEMAAEPGFVGASPLTTHFPFSNSDLEALQSRNDALFASGVLDSRLTLGRRDYLDETPPLEIAAATRRLFCDGVTMAAALAADSSEPDRFENSLLHLSSDVIAELSSVLERHQYSLHLDALETATLAACGDGHLATLLLPPCPLTYGVSAQWDRTETASPLVTLPVDIDHIDDMQACLTRFGLPRPGVIVFGSKISDTVKSSVMRQIQPPEAVFLDDSGDFFFNDPLPKYRALSVGGCLFLSRGLADGEYGAPDSSATSECDKGEYQSNA